MTKKELKKSIEFSNKYTDALHCRAMQSIDVLRRQIKMLEVQHNTAVSISNINVDDLEKMFKAMFEYLGVSYEQVKSIKSNGFNDEIVKSYKINKVAKSNKKIK